MADVLNTSKWKRETSVSAKKELGTGTPIKPIAPDNVALVVPVEISVSGLNVTLSVVYKAIEKVTDDDALVVASDNGRFSLAI